MEPVGVRPLTGFGKSPASTRFKKGASGNPGGRPKGGHRGLPYDAVLGQLVTIRENGRERQISAAEAFLLHATNLGLAGDGPTGRAALAAIESARLARRVDDPEPALIIAVDYVEVGSLTPALEPLAIGRRLDPYRSTVRVLLEPWVVEAALARLGERRLTTQEQRTVVAATRTPKRVRWPDWWTECEKR